jgi:hypothetical protein
MGGWVGDVRISALHRTYASTPERIYPEGVRVRVRFGVTISERTYLVFATLQYARCTDQLGSQLDP